MSYSQHTRAVHRRNIIIFLSIFLVTFAFWGFAALQKVFYDAVDVIKEFIILYPRLGVSTFIGFAALSGIVSPFSSVPLVPPAILIWGETKTTVYLATGWFLGSLIAYILAYFLGYPLVKRLSPFHKIEYYHQHLSSRAEFWFVFFFHLAFPSEVASYVCGIIRYNFGKYLIITAVVEFLFAVITISAGEAILQKKPLLLTALAAGTLLMVSAIVHLLHKHIAGKKKGLYNRVV